MQYAHPDWFSCTSYVLALFSRLINLLIMQFNTVLSVCFSPCYKHNFWLQCVCHTWANCSLKPLFFYFSAIHLHKQRENIDQRMKKVKTKSRLIYLYRWNMWVHEPLTSGPDVGAGDGWRGPNSRRCLLTWWASASGLVFEQDSQLWASQPP